jgi:3-hydroxyacyl-CoA dehydrogenase
MRAGLELSEHDLTIARAMAEVLTGGAVPPGTVVSEEHILALEVERMVALSRTPQSLARMEHMLATGKPLRN